MPSTAFRTRHHDPGPLSEESLSTIEEGFAGIRAGRHRPVGGGNYFNAAK